MFRFLDFGNRNLTVLISLAGGLVTQIVLHDHIDILLRHLLLVGYDYRHLMLAVHINALGQFNRNVAGLANGYLRTLNRTSGVSANHLDRQRPAVTICILITLRNLAVLVGLSVSNGNRNLTGLVGLICCIVIILVGHSDTHTLNGALILYQLYQNSGLVIIVQQSAVRQTDGNAVVLVQHHGRIGNRRFILRIRYRHQITAHNSLALAVSRTAVVDFLDRLRIQLFATLSTLLVLAAFGVRSRLLVDDPVTRLVTGCLGIIGLGGIAAACTGHHGVPHLRTSRLSDFGLIVMAQCLIQNRTAFRAKLRLRTGGRRTGNMTGSSISLDFVLTAANAVIFHHALTGTGRIRHQSALVPAMTERFRVIRCDCTAAAITAMNGLAAIFTGGGNHMVFVLVCQSRSNIFDVPLSANRALTNGIAGIGAGSRNRMGFKLVLTLGRCRFFHFTTARADF